MTVDGNSGTTAKPRGKPFTKGVSSGEPRHARWPTATSGAPVQSPALLRQLMLLLSIKKGQQAASSLSQAGGTSPDTQLTAKQLADMSEEQFAALYNELMAKGDRSKLMDLFGH